MLSLLSLSMDARGTSPSLTADCRNIRCRTATDSSGRDYGKLIELFRSWEKTPASLGEPHQRKSGRKVQLSDSGIFLPLFLLNDGGINSLCHCLAPLAMRAEIKKEENSFSKSHKW